MWADEAANAKPGREQVWRDGAQQRGWWEAEVAEDGGREMSSQPSEELGIHSSVMEDVRLQGVLHL